LGSGLQFQDNKHPRVGREAALLRYCHHNRAWKNFRRCGHPADGEDCIEFAIGLGYHNFAA